MSPGPKKKYGSFLAVRLELELRNLLEEIAEKEERTASQMARMLIREAIEAREKKKPRKPSKG